MSDGACVGTVATNGNYDLFFDPTRIREAKKVCRTCPVRIECLEYAIRNEFWEGVWGGTGPGERSRLEVRSRTSRLPLLEFLRQVA